MCPNLKHLRLWSMQLDAKTIECIGTTLKGNLKSLNFENCLKHTSAILALNELFIGCRHLEYLYICEESAQFTQACEAIRLHFKHHIDLQGLAGEHCERVDLQSDHSTPGFLRLSLSGLLESDHSITASLSHLGIVQIMGTQSIEELYNAVRLLYPIVVNHLKKPRDEGTFVPRQLRNVLSNYDSSVRL